MTVNDYCYHPTLSTNIFIVHRSERNNIFVDYVKWLSSGYQLRSTSNTKLYLLIDVSDWNQPFFKPPPENENVSFNYNPSDNNNIIVYVKEESDDLTIAFINFDGKHMRLIIW